MLHPELPACADCITWWYESKDWKIVERPKGTPLKRPSEAPTPCYSCPKIPRGEKPHPSNAIELSEQNHQVYAHYLKCKATNRFPEDGLVEWHAGLIRATEDDIATVRQERVVTAVVGMMTAVTTLARMGR